MKARKQFDINIIKLTNGSHHYQFDIDSSFFSEFENSFIEKGDLKVNLELTKSETMIQAGFFIEGNIELTCDRTLETFDEPISVHENLIFKYGEDFAELSEDIITIPRDLPTLNISQFVYEFIGLAVPMKKLHPRFRAEMEEALEDEETEGILIYSTGGDEEETEDENSIPDEEDKKDPRWEILNKLKKNLN
jgi:uncharacterized metal-binding protein YceD (DUF177 family)